MDMDWLRTFLHTIQAENAQIECKAALGKDGQGELPKDFWPTYSAFANTHGGRIVLGVVEKHGRFEAVGLPNATQIKTDLMNLLCSKQKVSACLTTEEGITEYPLANGHSVLVIEVRAADRSQRPVFINNQPFNAYHRFHSGDRLFTEHEVKGLIRDQGQSAWDIAVLDGFDFNDLDRESVAHYRQRFINHNPNHQFNVCDDQTFLRNIGVIRSDRKTKAEGLTKAGLLLLGQQGAIFEAFPHYFVDYQLKPIQIGHERWNDRVWPNNDWAGNLLLFYEISFRKILDNANLKLAFRMQADSRIEETSIHTAVREALVNTIVHADFESLMTAMTIRQFDHELVFENAGRMLIEPSVALEGAYSACRNPTLQRFFGLIGLGERAGTGICKIKLACEEHIMPDPVWEDIVYPPQTKLTLPLRQKSMSDFKVKSDLPFIDDLAMLSDRDRNALLEIAGPIAARARVSPEKLTKLYLKMCEQRYLTKPVMAELSNRSMPRIHAIINQLVKENRMEVFRKDKSSEMGYRTIMDAS